MVPAVILTLFLLAACSGGADNSATAGETSRLLVFAAASLTDAFTAGSKDFKAQVPGLDLQFSFAGSGALVAQLQAGAPADVVATADATSMQTLVKAGLVQTPRVFARNLLVIVVEKGNPKRIASLADLPRNGTVVVLADTSVPAGRYADAVLAKAKVSVRVRSREPDVRAAVARVAAGEADATIAYVTDVRAAAGRVDGVALTAAQNVTASYLIAVLQASRNPVAAAGFVDATVHGAVQSQLLAHGFLAAP